MTESKTKSKIQACISLVNEIHDESHPNHDELRNKCKNIESILTGLNSLDQLFPLSAILKVIEMNYENAMTESMIEQTLRLLIGYDQ